MRKGLITFLLSLSLNCSGQVGIGPDCLKQNSILFARIMLEVFGKQVVKGMLDEKKPIGFVILVDNEGYVQGVIRSWGKIPLLQQYNMVSKFRSYFKKNVVQVRICYALEDVGRTYEEQLSLARKSFRNQDEKVSCLFFPGELMDFYVRDKQRGYKGSRLDYLLLKLSEQKIPVKKKMSKDATKDD